MKKKNVRRDHPLGLYLHIPFCKAKCAYCDFYSLARSEEKMDAYTAALQRHLVEVAPQADCHIVDTVYFGGGTPSYLGVKRLTELLKTVKKYYRLAKEPEITVEANPDSACDWKALRTLRRAGVNRLSLGVQSTDDELLQAIGRVHTFAQVQEAVAAAAARRSKTSVSTSSTACPARRWPSGKRRCRTRSTSSRSTSRATGSSSSRGRRFLRGRGS